MASDYFFFATSARVRALLCKGWVRRGELAICMAVEVEWRWQPQGTGNENGEDRSQKHQQDLETIWTWVRGRKEYWTWVTGRLRGRAGMKEGEGVPSIKAGHIWAAAATPRWRCPKAAWNVGLELEESGLEIGPGNTSSVRSSNETRWGLSMELCRMNVCIEEPAGQEEPTKALLALSSRVCDSSVL